MKQDKIEKERQEKERNEYLIKQKEEEDKMCQHCNCGIRIINICMCEIPKYELVKLCNNLFCINCNKWKCRCKTSI